MVNTKRTADAEVTCNPEFVFIQSRSGGESLKSADPDGAAHLLAVDATDAALGDAILDALARSRLLTREQDPEEFQVLVSFKLIQQRYEGWVAEMMSRFKYASRQLLFRHMKLVHIAADEDRMVMMPFIDEKSETWIGADPEEYVDIARDSPAEEIGKALRVALTRCR